MTETPASSWRQAAVCRRSWRHRSFPLTAQFAAPGAFIQLTSLAFPENPGVWVKRNGLTEMAVGAAFVAPKTAALGKVGLIAYATWIGYNVANVQRDRS